MKDPIAIFIAGAVVGALITAFYFKATSHNGLPAYVSGGVPAEPLKK